MTTVHISLGRDDGKDQTAAKGVVDWEPTTRREDGTMVILERGFTVPLVAGEASVTVDPSGLTWCWRVTERTDSGGVVRYVSVPDSATTVEYVDLPDVDPTTLVPWTPADPEAAYLAALAGLDVAAAVAAYLLANPVSAPVSSVNGKVGAVALAADDVGADPAGTAAGLVGALVIPDSPDDIGAASAAHTHAPEDVTGTAIITTDARLSDARTPLAHSHTLADVTDAGDAAGLDVGTTAGTVMAGDDSRVTSLSSTYEAKRGADDNYVTDAEKAALHSHANKTALDQVSGTNTGDEPAASTTVAGVVELATTTEATTGADTTRAVTPAGVAAAIAGVGPAWPAGKWLQPCLRGGNQAGLTPEVGTEYALMLVIPHEVTIDAIGSRVWTGVESLVHRQGIYADENGAPSATVLHDLGTVSISGGGNRTATLGSPVTLAAGVYWASAVQQVGASAAAWLNSSFPRWFPLVGNQTNMYPAPLALATRTGSTGALSGNAAAWTMSAVEVGTDGASATKLPNINLRRQA